MGLGADLIRSPRLLAQASEAELISCTSEDGRGMVRMDSVASMSVSDGADPVNVSGMPRSIIMYSLC